MQELQKQWLASPWKTRNNFSHVKDMLKSQVTKELSQRGLEDPLLSKYGECTLMP